MGKLYSGGLIVWLVANLACAQGTLSLEDYLGQVKGKGADYQSAEASVEGLEKQSHQQDLTYSPQLVAGYNHVDDQSQQPTFLATTHTLSDSAGVSLTDKFPFGPSLSVGYAFNDINLTYSPQLLAAFGSNSSGLLSTYYQISPVVSLSVPLFKDFGGSQTSAGVKMVQYQLESAAKNSAFQREAVLYNAKVAYWNLALARESLTIRQDTLDRSQKIWEWNKRRVARNLADPPDALQAEASVRLAELDLQTAQERERSARLSFNRFRNQPDDTVPEGLEKLEGSLSILKVDIPEKQSDRLDLQAQEKNTQQQKATFDQAYQNIYPDITATASWRGNGLDPNYSYANEVAFGPDHPTWMLGAQFNLSLDVFTAQRTADGYQKNYESALLALKDKQIEVDQEWKDLRSHLTDVDKRLDMAAQIEEIQKNKADQERQRLDYGRTTEFQLLSFENDYNAARLNRLALILEKLSYLAQAQWWLAGENEEKE
ncbi:MAG TPA: TolC family protein [bacterium]|nr:TolC family protein [bacterium]